jgi:hypothetical protein
MVRTIHDFVRVLCGNIWGNIISYTYSDHILAFSNFIPDAYQSSWIFTDNSIKLLNIHVDFFN